MGQYGYALGSAAENPIRIEERIKVKRILLHYLYAAAVLTLYGGQV
jgi:hypothetical protein